MTADGAGTSASPVRATFVMEQHLGHRSFYENLRRATEATAAIASHWVPISYRHSTAVWDRLPAGAFRVRDAVIGRTQVRRGLADDQSDVLFFNTQVPAALGGRRIRQRPYVVCTDMTPRQFDRMSAQYDHRADGRGPLAKYKHAVNTRLFRDAARIVAWSSWVRQSLIDEYSISASKIEVIAPGLDLSLWKHRSSDEGPGPLRVLFVGGDFKRKGGQDLLDAFRLLPHGMAELHLVTRHEVANPPTGVVLHRNMTPNAPELVELYRSSDVFVLPSHGEAFGIAATEAAAIGLPVIGTRVGGLVDIVDDAVTGYLMEIGDVQHLVSLLRKLAEDPDLRRQLGSQGRERATRLFDAVKNADRIAALLADSAR